MNIETAQGMHDGMLWKHYQDGLGDETEYCDICGAPMAAEWSDYRQTDDMWCSNPDCPGDWVESDDDLE